MTDQDLAFDRDHLWHPYTSLTKPLPVYAVKGAQGVFLELEDGRRLIDGMSSWWTAIHGYNVTELNAAARSQLNRMSHVMFGGITHSPAIELGKRLVRLLPEGLDRIFLADSGSVSVEVAMKVAVQYQHARGRTQRTKFMTVRKGYHGDTSAAMSVCDPIGGMHTLFNDFLPRHFFAPAPAKAFDQKCDANDEAELTDFFNYHAGESAAFILEPIVQGAGGMRFYSPDYLRILRRLCDAHDVLLICDEIATGFGRTGKMFAVEHAGIVPDVICVGKGLTGGYLTLAAMACTPTVAETVCGGEAGVLMHGPTFMGNPLACAVAVASLDLLVASPWSERVKAIEKGLTDGLASLSGHPSVREVRVLGAIGVIETEENVEVAAIQRFFVDRGVWIRPFRNLIYVMPPYVISPEELRVLTQAMVAYFNQ